MSRRQKNSHQKTKCIREKGNSDKCNREEPTFFNKLKANYLKAKRACIKDLCTSSIQTKTLKTKNLIATNIQTVTINGKLPDCQSSLENFSSNIDEVQYVNGLPIQPSNDGRFNQVVLDNLWQETLFYQKVIQDDINCGRLRNRLIENLNGCTVCPPTSECNITGWAKVIGSITGDILTIQTVIEGSVELFQQVVAPGVLPETTIISVEGNQYRLNQAQNLPSTTIWLIPDCPVSTCPPVPLRIYGVETVPPGVWDSVCKTNQALSTLAYNLDVINRSTDLSTKVVTTLIQVGWVNSENNFVTRQINLSNRQFSPSLAAVFGEKYSETTLLPTSLIEEMIAAMPPIVANNAAVQLVVYIEEGIQIFTPPTFNTSQKSTNQQRVINDIAHNGNVSASYATSPNDLSVTLTETSQNPWPIPSGVSRFTITAVGGGGGGGRAVYLSVGLSSEEIVAGGGGGSGRVTSSTVDFGNTSTGPLFIRFEIGQGGSSDTPGGATKIAIVNAAGNPLPGLSFESPGGNAGGAGFDGVTFNQAGGGGNGYYGGGGGATPSHGDNPGRNGPGGSGDAPQGDGQDGQGNTLGGTGGPFTIVNEARIYQGGQGGSYPPTTETTIGSGAGGGGGGGGGKGGGNGGGTGHIAGYDALPGSSSGGGGAAGAEIDALNLAAGGNGASGYVVFSPA